MKILNALMIQPGMRVYLIDTNVISEMRKKSGANRGVSSFFQKAAVDEARMYISVVTVGELRRGVESIRYRGDAHQADRLNHWLEALLADYRDHILDINADIAQVWGVLSAPHPQNTLDKQIAATALVYDLKVVTRNEKDFFTSGVSVLNPFKKDC